MHILFLIFNVLLILLYFVHIQGKNIIILNNQVRQKNETNSTTYSPWLRRIKDPRSIGCWRQPWICNQGEFPRIRRLCCRNRCVDVTSDPNNCGLCGIRCPFTRQCCRGLCVNTNLNPFHCGRCDHLCVFPSFCLYGMCGYAQPLPPFPFPPRPPKPFPPRPPKPFPPKPPKPFPPRPPKPFPPRPFPPRPRPPKPPRGGRDRPPPVE